MTTLRCHFVFLDEHLAGPWDEDLQLTVYGVLLDSMD
jgi:hypothetical protein